MVTKVRYLFLVCYNGYQAMIVMKLPIVKYTHVWKYGFTEGSPAQSSKQLHL